MYKIKKIKDKTQITQQFTSNILIKNKYYYLQQIIICQILSIQIQMDTEQLQSPTQNQIQMMVRQLLPQIQEDLEKQYQQKYDQEMKRKIHEEQIKMLEQAEAQYMQMLQMIQKQSENSVYNRYNELQKQLNDLENIRRDYQNKLKSEKRAKIQQDFLLNKFETEILVHPYFVNLQKNIAEEVEEKFKQKYETELNRRQKQFLVKLKQKEDKEQQQFQRDYRQQCQHRIQQEKKQLQKIRVQLARFKSDYNIKVKKFTNEKKQYQTKYKESSASYEKYKQSLENQLTKLLEQRQRQMIKNHKKKIDEAKYQEQSDNQKYYDESKRESQQDIDDEDQEIPTQKTVVPMKMISSSSSDQFLHQQRISAPKAEQSSNMSSFWSKPKKIIDFDAKHYLQSMMQSEQENMSMMNQKQQQKDFIKYIPTKNETEKKQKKSNFREEYERYLKSISIVKKNKLSIASKNIIINNFIKSAGQNKKTTSIR